MGGPAAQLAYGAWHEAEDVLAYSTGSRMALLDRHGHQRSIKARRVVGRAARRIAGRRTLLPPGRSEPVVETSDHAYGRRDPVQHEEILDWAASRQALYLYDTVRGHAADWEEHRTALAGWYQHTNVAICNYAKHDLPAVTGGLRALPGRLYETLASGAIPVGLPPDLERQNRILGQPVVEALDGTAHQLAGLLDRFRDPVEARPLRIRNLALACRGHDWGHRWAAVYEAIGMRVPFGLQNRLDDLAKRADEFEGLIATD